MHQYLFNMRAFLSGFSRLDDIEYKAGWGPRSFLLVFLIDYGSHVLSGGAVVSWSRWFYDNRQYRIPRFFDRLLNHFEDGHGRSAGPPLWGTQDCSPLFRCAAVAFVLFGVWA